MDNENIEMAMIYQIIDHTEEKFKKLFKQFSKHFTNINNNEIIKIANETNKIIIFIISDDENNDFIKIYDDDKKIFQKDIKDIKNILDYDNILMENISKILDEIDLLDKFLYFSINDDVNNIVDMTLKYLKNQNIKYQLILFSDKLKIKFNNVYEIEFK